MVTKRVVQGRTQQQCWSQKSFHGLRAAFENAVQYAWLLNDDGLDRQQRASARVDSKDVTAENAASSGQGEPPGNKRKEKTSKQANKQNDKQTQLLSHSLVIRSIRSLCDEYRLFLFFLLLWRHRSNRNNHKDDSDDMTTTPAPPQQAASSQGATTSNNN